MKNKKIILTIFSITLVVILGLGLYFSNSDRTYSASDVLKDVDFSTEPTTIDLRNMKGEEIIIYELTEKTQKDLVNAFEKSKFKKNDNPILFSNDFLMTITINRSYTMFLDMDNKGIGVVEGDSYVDYLFEDDNGFFSILDKVVTE